MKKLYILFLFVCLFTMDLFSWDSTAAKYMPLQIGNTWIYISSLISSSGSGTSLDKYTVTGTQTINGKVYYNLSGIHVLLSGSVSCGSRLFSANTQIRIDSNTMNLMRIGICNNNSEGLVDSLGAGFRDSTITCFNFNSTKSCFNDSAGYNIFNTYFKSKRFTTIDLNGGNDQTYLEGIGLARYYASISNYTCNQNLKGCVINGIVFGDTSIIVGINQINSGIPDRFELSQNYPNPFNPVTKIKFEIPASVETSRRDVLFTIYDALGKEVQVLVNQQLQPGTYSVDWDASAFPSGVYYYKLETQNYSETKKMVLIK